VTRYELLDRIGVGGMAEIFRGKAVAAGGFEKPVAIKRILPHLSSDTRFVELLIAEAKVLSLLKHRNIVQIFDVGLGDDSQYFLVMEFVDGKDLGAIQRALESMRRRVPFDLALHIGAEICEALEHAHVARAPDGKLMSLVHRDVSPSNVLLSRAGEVKLTDFGIAKRAEAEVTRGAAVRGKFAYISPEQARNEQIDPRGDVFSVGILMWELLCNRRLFSGLDDLAALRAVREAKIQRPTEVDPRLPPEIDAIVMTALAKDKKARYPSAGAFGQKLRSLRYSLEVTVGDPSTELAKLVESTEEVERESEKKIEARPSKRFDFEASESTVIRIRTADAFNARDSDASIFRARQVIDRFEEEETRLAQLTGEQMRILRSRDSNEEMTAAASPRATRESAAQLPRAHRDSDEDETRMREPLTLDEPAFQESSVTPSNQTRLLATRDLPPRAGARPATKQPPTRNPTPGPTLAPDTPNAPPFQPQAAPFAPAPGTIAGPPSPIPPAMAPMPQPPQAAPFQPQAAPFQPQAAPFQPQAAPFQPQQAAPFQPQQAAPFQPQQAAPFQPQAAPFQPQQAAPFQPQAAPFQQPQAAPFQPQAAPFQPQAAPFQPQAAPFQQPQAAPFQQAAYPPWGTPIAPQRPVRDATPTAQDALDRPAYPRRTSTPEVAGFGAPTKSGLVPWMLVVGALVMAAVAFAITRAFIG
jgi:serine/threonine-protein kinase